MEKLDRYRRKFYLLLAILLSAMCPTSIAFIKMKSKPRHQNLPDSTPLLESFQVELQKIEKNLTDAAYVARALESRH